MNISFINPDNLIGEGSHHRTYGTRMDDFVIKVPKKESPILYKQAEQSTHFFESWFPDFIPRTIKIEQDDSYGYRAYQERIYNASYVADILGTSYEEQILIELQEFTLRAKFLLQEYSHGFDIGGSSKLEDGSQNIDALTMPKLMGMTNFLVGSTLNYPEEKKLFFIDTIVSSHSVGNGSRIIATISPRRKRELQRREAYIYGLEDEIRRRLKKIP